MASSTKGGKNPYHTRYSKEYGERAHEVEGQVHGNLAHVCGISSAAEGKEGRGKEWLSQPLSLNADFFLFPLILNFSQMLALSMTLLRQTVIPKLRGSVCKVVKSVDSGFAQPGSNVGLPFVN